MKYYKKLVYTFTTVAAVFVVIISFIFITVNYISNLKEKNNRIALDSALACEYTDNRIQSSMNLGELLLSNAYLKDLISDSPQNVSYPTNYARTKIQQYLQKTVTVAYNGTSQVAVTQLFDDYAIMTTSTGNLEHMYKKLSITEIQFKNAVDTLDTNPSLLYLLIKGGTENKPKYVIIRKLISGHAIPLYLLMAFDEENFINLDAIKDYNFFVFDNRGSMIFMKGNSGIFFDDNQNSITSNNYISYENQVGISGLKYYIFSNKPPLADSLFWLLLVFTICALFICYLIMKKLAQNVYSPIANLLHISGAKGKIGDEFSYITKTINDMSSSVNILSQTVSRYEYIVQNKFFYDLLTGHLSDSEIDEQLDSLGLKTTEKHYVAVIIQYDETISEGDFSENITYNTRKELSLRLANELSECDLYRIIDLNLNKQCMIFSTDDIAALSDCIKSILLSAEPEHGIEVSAYVGSVVNDIRKIHSSYLDAIDLAENNEFFTMKAKVSVPEYTVKTQLDTPVYYPFMQEQALINAIKNGKKSIYVSVIDAILNKNDNSNPEKYEQLITLLAATIQRLISASKHPLRKFIPESSSPYSELRKCLTVEELKKKNIEIFDAISDNIASDADKYKKSLEDEMLEYIHENFSKDISLYDLADHLNVSKNYASTLFKNHVGKNFKEYLSLYRFNKATEIIKNEPKIKINEIAKKVGLNAVSLNRLFIKYSSMTPSEYQKSHNYI